MMVNVIKPQTVSRVSQAKYLVVDNLLCTEKGKSLLKSKDEALSVRERQFLRLLNNNDFISRRACARILTKIPLQEMLDAGLVAKREYHQDLSKPDSSIDSITSSCNIDSDVASDVKDFAKPISVQSPVLASSMADNDVETSNSKTGNSNSDNDDDNIVPPAPSGLLQVIAGAYLLSS